MAEQDRNIAPVSSQEMPGATLAIDDLVIDPEIQPLIPPASDDELALLERNIVEEGRCRDPLVVWKGRRILLDGHNRRDVILRHGVDYHIAELAFADADAAKAWVIRNELGRRNIPDFARAELALKLKPLITAKAKQNQRESGGAVPQKSAEPVDTREALAKAAGVSHDTIRKVERVLDSADPEVVALARQGVVSINAAAKVAARPKAEQRQAVSRGAEGVKAMAKQHGGNLAATASPPPVDATGRTIESPEVAAAFAAARGLDEVADLLTAVAKKLKAIARGPAGVFFDVNSIEGPVEELVAEIASRRPHAVCRFCGGRPDLRPGGCDPCKGTGFLPKGGPHAFATITPEELQ